MKLFFVRHGQTNYNLRDLCNDDPNKEVHLTDLGKKQARKVAEKMRNIKFDLVIISEFPRTKETALIIAKDSKAKLKVEPRINDRKTGFDSRPVMEFNEAISSDQFNLKFNEGESFQEEKKRVHSFLEELKQYKYEKVLVVTHNEVIKIIYGILNKLSDKEIWNLKI